MKSNLFKEIPVKVLLALKDKSSKGKNKSKIARKVNCTNAHCSCIMDGFEDIGLSVSEKSGRSIITRLTKKGEKIADKFILINQKIAGD